MTKIIKKIVTKPKSRPGKKNKLNYKLAVSLKAHKWSKPVIIFLISFIVTVTFSMRLIQPVIGASYTWDGGGTDGTCGGSGTANNWSCRYNWTTDTTPTATDTVIFDFTSTKNVKIDTNTTVAGITITADYIGTITQNTGVTLTVNGSITQANGVFTGGNSTIDLNGSLSITAGTFTATSGTMTASGDVSATGTGVFDTQSSTTLTFDGSAHSTLTCTKTLPGTMTLNKAAGYAFTLSTNCGVSLGASPSTLASGGITNNGTITVVSGAWTLNGLLTNNGTINQNGSGLSVSGVLTNNTGATLTLAGGTLTATSITNSGVLNYTTTTWTLGYPVTNNGTLNLTASTWDINTSVTNNTGATITMTGTAITVSNNFTQNGTFDTTGKTITFDTSGGTSTLTCNTTIGGTVVLNKTDQAIANNTFTLSTGCTISLGADPIVTMYNFTNNGTVNIPSGAFTVRGYLTNTGTITHSGSGMSTGYGLTNSGTLTLAGGTLTGTITNSGTINQNGASLTVTSYTQTAGSFVGGSGAIDINGSITISGGTFSNSSANMTVSNNMTVGASATYIGTNKTITFDTSSYPVVLTCSGELGGKVIIDKTAYPGSFEISQGCTVNLGASPVSGAGYYMTNRGTIVIESGNWTLTTGVLNNYGTIAYNGGSITIYGPLTNYVGGSISLSTGSLYASGGYSNSGTITLSKSDGGTLSGGSFTNNSTGILTLSSGVWVTTSITNSGTVNHTGTGWDMNGSLVNNSGGVITYSGTDISISNNFTQNGTFNLTNKTITFDTSSYPVVLTCSGELGGKVIIDKTAYPGSFEISQGCTVNLGASPVSGAGYYMTNRGTIVIESGNWTLTTGVLNNYGTIAYNGGSITIYGPLTNYVGGSISLSTGSLYASGGYSNSGTITLSKSDGGTLSGGSFTNNSTGILTLSSGVWVTTSITNSGTVNHTGTGWDMNGSLVNNSGGVITYSGTDISISNNFTQNGTFNLTNKTITFDTSSYPVVLTCSGELGGKVIIDKTAYPGSFEISQGCTVNLGASPVSGAGYYMTNRGTIVIESGNWTLTTGVLNNYGTIAYNGGSITIYGPLTNYVGGSISLSTGSLYASGGYSNSGTITLSKSDGGTLSGGSFTNNSTGILTLSSGVWVTTSITNSGTVNHTGTGWDMNGSLVNNSGGVITLSGSTLTVSADFTQNGTFNLAGKTLTMDSTTNGTLTCTGTLGGTVVWSKSTGAGTATLSTGCIINLGDGPISAVNTMTNNGTINISSGSWTLNLGSYLYNYGTINHNGVGMTINGYLVTYTGSTFTIASGPFLITNAFSNTGTFTLNSGTFTANTTVANSGTMTHRGSSWVQYGDLTNNSGATITYSGSTMTINGVFTQNGTFDWTGKAITYGGNGNQTLNCNGAISGLVVNKGGGSLTLASNCTVNGNVTLTAGTIANPGSPYTLTVNGNLTITAGTFGGANLPVVMGGNTDTTITHNGGTFQSPLTIQKVSNTTTLATGLTVTGQNCTVTSGTLNLDGKNISCGGGTLSVAASGILKLKGSETTITTPTFSSGSTAFYNGTTSSYTLKNWTYKNVTIDGASGTFFIGQAITVTGDLNINNGTFDINGYNLTVTGLMTVGSNGTFKFKGGETVPDPVLSTGSTVYYYGVTGPYTLKTWSFYNLILNGLGQTFSMSQDLSLPGNLSILAGTFNPNGKSITLTGTNQTLSGNLSFVNLTKNISSADILTLGASTTITVSGTMTLIGALGQRLSLRSTSTGTQANILSAAVSVSHLDVKDNNNLGNAIQCLDDCYSSGNNTNWVFDTVSPTGSILINEGASYVNSQNVTLSLVVSDNHYVLPADFQMMISINSEFSGASWESYLASKTWTLMTGDGAKTIYAKYKDASNNVSEVYSATTILETSPPTNPTTSLGFSDSATISADLTDGNWANYARPKFTWPEGVDPGSGVAGYYMFLSSTNTTVPIDNSSNTCYVYVTNTSRQFIVGTTPSTCSVTNGIWYLRVQSVDNAGNIADPSTIFTYKYDGSIPDAPANVVATTIGYSSLESYTFFWPSVADNGPSGIEGYEYKTGTSSGQFAFWQLTTSTQIAGIPPYKEGQNLFYVRSKDVAGNYSATTSNQGTSSFYYNRSAPTAPRNVVVSPDSSVDSPSISNLFTVTWEKPATYSGEIAKYYYCVNCTPSSTNMTEASASESASLKIENKTLASQQGKNTFYLVAEDNNVNADTGHGNRNFEAYASVDFFASTTSPGAPSTLTITDSSDRDSTSWRLTLAWQKATTGGTPSQYIVYRSADNIIFTEIGNISSTAYTDADITQGILYYYKVKAVDNAGASSLFSNTVSKAAEGKYSTPPTAGGTPTVTTGSTTATIKWTTSRTSFGTVEYGKTIGYGSAATETTATKDHVVKITGLAPGTSYHFRVQALDEGDLMGYDRVDAYSADYSFTTLNSASISSIDVTDIGLDSAVVSWKTSSLATSVIEYGTTSTYGLSISSSTVASESAHTSRLTGLTHSTTYHFRVRGTTSDADDIFSEDNSFETVTFPKVTALLMNTDQGAGGTTAVLAWSTNVATTGEVEYQAAGIENPKQYSIVELQKMSQTDLARVPIIPKGSAQTTYSGKMEKKHIQRIENLSDGSIYIFTIKGRDQYGNQTVSDPIRYVTGVDTRPPVISNVIIETPITGMGTEAKAQIIISWDTDEAAYGQVMWGTGTGSEYPQASEKDTNLTTKHVVVIRDLLPTSSYHLKIVSTDKTGNTIESKDTVVVTPASQQAAFDVIIKNLEDVFGFLKI